jgi:hypothetical protein
MGDLRLLRNDILHNKGVISPKTTNGLKKLCGMFVVDQPIHISYENMHQIFVLIKQNCARMLLEGLSVEGAPIQPEDIVDIAIQER